MSQETTTTEKSIGRTDQPTNYCPHCEREFPPEKAHSIEIHGPGEVRWTCPNCKKISKGIAPEEVARPPVIDNLDVTAEDGLTTAAIEWPNGARLQIVETADGFVREEVISSADHELDSFSIGRQEDINTYHEFARTIKRYCELTEPGLRCEMPHLAAALLDDHKR